MMNILDASALTDRLPKLLPETDQELKNSHDGLAALIHTVLTVLEFRLIALDDSSPSLPTLGNILPSEWNKNGPGSYTFKYKHDQSSLDFLIKISKLGLRTLVNAIALENDKVATLDLSTKDFISPSFFPYDCAGSDGHPLAQGFISSNRIDDLISHFKLKILQKLIPGLRKEGYHEEETPELSSSSSQPPPPETSSRSQVAPPDTGPWHERYHQTPSFPRDNPLQIGRRDLDPIPLNPFSPPSLFGGPLSGDGMFVGPDHPIWAGGNPARLVHYPERGGPWGGDGYLPQMGAPPGARFDPIGPDPYSGLGQFPPRGGRGDSFGRGRWPTGLGGPHAGPDNDEFMPPGMGSMYM